MYIKITFLQEKCYQDQLSKEGISGSIKEIKLIRSFSKNNLLYLTMCIGTKKKKNYVYYLHDIF